MEEMPTNEIEHQNMDNAIIAFLSSMGLLLPFSILIPYRAGKLRGLTMNNYEERVGDLAFDTIKGEICSKLQECFDLYFNMQNGQFPNGLNIGNVAANIHGDVENIEILQNIYFDLVNYGVQSASFVEALQSIIG